MHNEFAKIIFCSLNTIFKDKIQKIGVIVMNFKEKHDVNFFKNVGQFIICPILAFFFSMLAMKTSRITGYFSFLFGGIIFCAFVYVFVVIMDKLIIAPMEENNARIEQEERENLLRMIEEENDPDEYSEYND